MEEISNYVRSGRRNSIGLSSVNDNPYDYMLTEEGLLDQKVLSRSRHTPSLSSSRAGILEEEWCSNLIDSGNEDDDELLRNERLHAQEPLMIPSIDDETYAENIFFQGEAEIFNRQLSYPPVPKYYSPMDIGHEDDKTDARERLGTLTPMEECTEPPSSAGTIHNGRLSNRRMSFARKDISSIGKIDLTKDDTDSGEGRSASPSDAGSYVASNEKKMKPSSSKKIEFEDIDPKNFNEVRKQIAVSTMVGNVELIHKMEQIEKVRTWQMGGEEGVSNDTITRLDAEFPSLLDSFIQSMHQINVNDENRSPGDPPELIPTESQEEFLSIASQMTSYMGQISAQTLLTNMPQVIPLLSSLLMSTSPNFRAQRSALAAIEAFSKRLKDCKAFSGLKAIPNCDLTWLLRNLCEVGSDSSKSFVKTDCVATISALVKYAGPEMICNPIYFILMESDEKSKHKKLGRDGKAKTYSGQIVSTAKHVSGPKVKSMAIDVLTYALILFPRDEFDMEVVAKMACHALLHEKRRLRQAALECVAVLANVLSPQLALPMIRQFLLDEQETRLEQENAIKNDGNINKDTRNSDEGNSASEKMVEIHLGSNRSSRKATSNTSNGEHRVDQHSNRGLSPTKSKRPSPGSAVSARVSRHILPSVSHNDLIEYGVKIPSSTKTVMKKNRPIDGFKISSENKMSSHESEASFRSYRSANGSSASNFDLIDLEPVLKAPSGVGARGESPSMASDIAWVMEGSGPIRNCDGPKMPRAFGKLTEDSDSSGNTPVVTPTSAQYEKRNGSWNNDGRNSSYVLSIQEHPFSNGINNQNKKIRSNINSNGYKGHFLSGKSSPSTKFEEEYLPFENLSGIENKESHASQKSSQASGLLITDPNTYDMNSVVETNMSFEEQFSSLNGVSMERRFEGGDNLKLSGSHLLQDPSSLPSPRYQYLPSGDPNHRMKGSASNGKYTMLPKKHSLPKASNGYSMPIGLNGTLHGGGLVDIHSVQSSLPGSNVNEEMDSYGTDSLDFDLSNMTVSGPFGGYKPVKTKSPGNRKKKDELLDGGLLPLNHLREKYFLSDIKNGIGSAYLPDMNGGGDTNVHRSPSSTSFHDVYKHREENDMESHDKKLVERMSQQIEQEEIKSSNDILHSPIQIPEQEYQVYHATITHSQNPFLHQNEADLEPKTRMERDSAGSTNTRDSGVSLDVMSANQPYTKKSYTTRPPTGAKRVSHITRSERRPSVNHSRRKSDGYLLLDSNALARSWKSVPDVPTASDSEPDYNNGIRSSSDYTNPGSSIRAKLHASSSTSRDTASGLLHRKPVQIRTIRRPSVSSEILEDFKPAHRVNSMMEFSDSLAPTKDPHFRDLEEYRRTENSSPQSLRHITSSVSAGNILEGKELPSSASESMTSNLTTSLESHQGLSKSHRNASRSPSKRMYRGSYREVNAKIRVQNHPPEVYPESLQPVVSPKHSLPMALGQLQSSDWETNVDGFKLLVRITRFNPDFMREHLNNVNMNALRHLMNLRSQVCRAAILFFREIFNTQGRSLEPDVEKIAEKLMDKAADTNKFIREDSGSALEAMVFNISPSKTIHCLEVFGLRHRNPAARCMTARMINKLIAKVGAERCICEYPEKLLLMLCKLLQEGSLETRKHTKLALSSLKKTSYFEKQLRRFVSPDLLRHVEKSINSIR